MISTPNATLFSQYPKIEFCLGKWNTGVLVRQKLHEPSLKEKFAGHLRDVIKWDGIAPEVTKNIRQKIFANLRYAQVMLHIWLTQLLTPILQHVCRSSRCESIQCLADWWCIDGTGSGGSGGEDW